MVTKRKLKEERDNAEQRALIHFRKVQNIENILYIAEINKTPAVYIVDKVKEVIRRLNKITSKNSNLNK